MPTEKTRRQSRQRRPLHRTQHYQGKARSSQNSRKHSFAGAGFSIVRIEDREAVDHLRAELIAVYQPVNSQELFAIERNALAQHSLLRMARFEVGLCTTAVNYALLDWNNEDPIIPLHDALQVPAQEVGAQNRAYYLAQGFDRMNRLNSSTWSLFLRYQAQAERQYRRAVEDFDRLKSLRNDLSGAGLHPAAGFPTPPAEVTPPLDVLPNEPNFDPQPEETPATSAPDDEPTTDPPALATGPVHTDSMSTTPRYDKKNPIHASLSQHPDSAGGGISSPSRQDRPDVHLRTHGL